MYFETGADSLRGILSPGAYHLRGGLSLGHIVSGAYCLPGRIVSGQIISWRIVLGQAINTKTLYYHQCILYGLP